MIENIFKVTKSSSTMEKEITIAKLDKYYQLTSKALSMAKNAVAKSKQKQANEIIIMVECYLKDSQHFKEKNDLVNAFGCLNYAHGWLDCGARLKIFKVTDNYLFTV